MFDGEELVDETLVGELRHDGRRQVDGAIEQQQRVEDRLRSGDAAAAADIGVVVGVATHPRHQLEDLARVPTLAQHVREDAVQALQRGNPFVDDWNSQSEM